MDQSQLRRLVFAWCALALCYESLAVGWVAWHAGWLSVPGIAVGPVSVILVEETEDRGKLTPGQREIFTSHAADSFLTWIATHGEQDAAGAYRIVDKDDSMSQDEAKWQTAFQAKGPSVPWLVVTRDGNVLLSEAMPATAEETMRILKKYGGN